MPIHDRVIGRSRGYIVVPGDGPDDADWMAVGEAPGEDEAHADPPRPFVGRAGRVQDEQFRRNGLSRSSGYLTNLRKTYIPGNPAPTPDEIAEWAPVLMDEIARIRPRFIIAVGDFAIKFFLPDASLSTVHGMPQRSDKTSAVVIPVYHPAAPFYNPELLQFVSYDYSRAAAIILGKASGATAVDQFPAPAYRDGDDLDINFVTSGSDIWAVDTEGVPGDEWSFQVTGHPGMAAVCTTDHPRFPHALARFADRIPGKTLVGHNLMYEFEMFAALGFDLLDPDLGLTFFDTQMAAYLLCMEPQGLKELSRRWLGMEMRSYMEVTEPPVRDRRIEYLANVLNHDWPIPEPRVVMDNAGRARVYTPQPVDRRVTAIITDVCGDKVDKDGEPIDPGARWKQLDLWMRRQIEKRCGPFPQPTLRDIPRADAIYYAGRDPDATLRLYLPLRRALEAQGLIKLMDEKMAMLPAAAKMKINGMLARRSHFEDLSARMQERKDAIRDEISHLYFSDRPFNPNSTRDVQTLMRRRGLHGEKKTPGGEMSTSKRSIEHLRFTDPAIAMIEDWREHDKIKSSFADPIVERFPEGADYHRIQGDIKTTRVTSGRFAMADPNLMAIPVRNELGLEVRRGFVADEDYVIGSWDLDQAEMRWMAEESGDERMCKIFIEGKIDIHTDTASRCFGIPYPVAAAKENKMKYRYPAKRAGFLVITGGQEQALLDQLRMAGCVGWDLHKVGKLQREWFKLFPGVKRYMESCKEDCRRAGGVIRDYWGMPRYLPAILGDDQHLRWEAERQSHSHRIQGGAQGWLQNAMGWLYPRLYPYGDLVRWLLQVHDALMLEVHESIIDIIDPLVREAMTRHGGRKMKVPMTVQGAFAKSWGDLKD